MERNRGIVFSAPSATTLYPRVRPCVGPKPPRSEAPSSTDPNANRSRFLSSVNTLCDNNAANGQRRRRRRHAFRADNILPHHPYYDSTRWLVWMPKRHGGGAASFPFGPSQTTLLVAHIKIRPSLDEYPNSQQPVFGERWSQTLCESRRQRVCPILCVPPRIYWQEPPLAATEDVPLAC